MTDFDRKKHWDSIYDDKSLEELSWYQSTPTPSLKLIESCDISKSDPIIDIGGGNSLLVDHLLEKGYQHLTVLDISEKAIKRAQQRLEDQADNVNWIVKDVIAFNSSDKFDVWHDRATFHFLTSPNDIGRYLKKAHNALNKNGYLILGTFSTAGPESCSGLNVQQYSKKSMDKQVSPYGFNKLDCITQTHKTPGGTPQEFLFCRFQKIST